ncbi:hypothetical protein POPTR_008G088700v4 [Populus trichocarpa]|uniref:Uncharacterized protein n=4 Tax=Populus trichocarpa TaxID=3694 RepID=A0ACC0SKH7_POPTR|nr:casparian strip membrane protein 5 [Populus trichocarpa]XP_024462650.2 casparian strip membrane protein 5 [Populus trichocarpa]KAI9389754.1 hypothetical protein POPTR_008G088700v4 [Populus trichocarpa]KAI9389755.1 hypothetical protein POPTR_008G088700v4 [Populus trichocarpa]KAI9389756.1 hypothetical protein POPTR_008G088700v4 [Populus trichocarpa]KAI9389757.1 hypothetical protein POPTR_008G088700v4 [Populus trichocarpa]
MKAEAVESGEASTIIAAPKRGINRGISIADLILRGVAAIGTFASALTMGTTSETLTIFTQPIMIRAKYNDLPSLTFFVIANSIVCGYLVLSIPLSISHFIRREARITRIILVIFDTAMVELLTAGAAAATVVVYLAHKRNANWLAICQQFNNFCERISGSLIGSFASIIMIMLIIITSAVALSRH